MDVIFMPEHLLWQRLQCVHIHSLIMHCHTVNVCCNAVINFHVSIFLTKKQIISIQTQQPQYRPSVQQAEQPLPCQIQARVHPTSRATNHCLQPCGDRINRNRGEGQGQGHGGRGRDPGSPKDDSMAK